MRPRPPHDGCSRVGGGPAGAASRRAHCSTAGRPEPGGGAWREQHRQAHCPTAGRPEAPRSR
eukprot:5307051-Alexandrium_andersonii.AAC.1